MMAFFLEPDQIDVFIELCELTGAKTPEQQQRVLFEMAQVGLVKNVTQVNMTKQEYIQHLAKNFGSVLDVSKGDLNNGNPS